MSSPNTWTGVLDQIFRGFLVIEDVGPDWLVEPATGRGLVLDILYPELGIAFWFRDSGGTAMTGTQDYEAILIRQ